MIDRSTLVFPGGIPAGLTWARRALLSGTRLVVASSPPNDPAGNQYPQSVWLPWMGDPDFDTGSEAFADYCLYRKFAACFDLQPMKPAVPIDGKHPLWRNWVQPGGDGPRIAADEFRQEFAGSLVNVFVIGGGLFLRVLSQMAK